MINDDDINDLKHVFGADNVIDFATKQCGRKLKEPTERQMFAVSMTVDTNGEYSVYMEVEEEFEDFEIGIALEAMTQKFWHDHDLKEITLDELTEELEQDDED